MRLADALRLAPGRSVAFTGAGGKSAALLRLVRELAEEMPVLLTTTTRLGREQSKLAAQHVALTPGQAPPDLSATLAEHGSVLVTGELLEAESKWTALSEAHLTALREAAQAAGAVLLIEADGARGKSLKAPAEHEPAIPSFVDLVVPVAGLDAIGERLDSQAVHRPERLAGLLGVSTKGLIQPEHLATVLSSPQGGLKGVPAQAEIRVLLNKADDESQLSAGRQVAGRLLEPDHPIHAVILASLAGDQAVQEVHGHVAGIVLAAGESSRLGVPKQLIPWRGKPLIWHAVESARQAGLSPLVAVVGSSADRVSLALEGTPATVVENPVWQAGQSGSVRLGLAEARAQAEAAVFLLSDTPLVTGELIRELVGRHRRTLSPLVAPRAGGRRANPVLFDRSTFPTLDQLEGDQGGRSLFDRFPAEWVEWDEGVLLDLDAPEDLNRLKELE